MNINEIQELTIVSAPGVKVYTVGVDYNGLTLDNILNETLDFPNSYISIYRGWTNDKRLVFETINAPVEVAYTL